MTCRDIHNQFEYDAAKDSGDHLHIVAGYIVLAYGSASVEAYGSASVEAYGSASVRAYGSASIHAFHAVTVAAARYVAIHKHDHGVTITGGTVIEVPDLQGGTPADWCDYYGLPVTDGYVTVYKGVDDNYTSAHGATYVPGTTVTAPDWRDTPDCGNGLHFSPTPRHTHAYTSPAHYLACRIPVNGMVTLGDKVKTASCEVLHEVDADGEPLAVTAVAK